MVIRELLFPVPQGDLDGLVVPAVSALRDDPIPTVEGNDAVHGTGVHEKIRHQPSASKGSGPRVVVFSRALGPRDAGQDVIAVQRALQAAGFRKMRPSGWMGPLAVAQVKAFQKAHKTQPTGLYGQTTHHTLSPFFDAYGAWLMMLARKDVKLHEMRQRIVAAALYGVSVRDRIGYTQGPHRLDAIVARLKPPKFPSATDCSGFGTWCYQVAGAPDPCGYGYDVRRGEHFTGTMAIRGHKVAKPQIGDLLLYGSPPTYEHVTIYIGSGRCASHGTAAGPSVIPMDYRPIAQARSYL